MSGDLGRLAAAEDTLDAERTVRRQLAEALRENEKILGAAVRDPSFMASLGSDALRDRIRKAHNAARLTILASEALDG